MLNKTSILAALGGLAALAATNGAAQAQCDHCNYQTYYRPVVVRHCAHIVPHTVLQPVVTNHVVPVVSYQTVQRTHYVPQTYYTRYYTTERVNGGYDGYAGYQGGGYGGYQGGGYGGYQGGGYQGGGLIGGLLSGE